MGESGRRVGGAAGVLAAILLTAALATMPPLPGPTASALDSFDFFTADEQAVRAGALLTIIAMVMVGAFFGSLRATLAQAGAPYSAGAMVVTATLAAGAQAFAAACLATPALRAATAEPETTRALLDLADAGVAVSGAAFAAALLSAAVAIRRLGGPLPRPLAWLAILAAIGNALWLGRLLTDTGVLAADGALGFEPGAVLLLAWIAGAGLWLLSGRASRPAPLPARSPDP